MVFRGFGRASGRGADGEGAFATKRLASLILAGVFSIGIPPPAGAVSACPFKGHLVGDGRWTRRGVPPLEVRSVRIRFEDGAIGRMQAVRLRHQKFKIRLHWREKYKWFSPIDLSRLGERMGAVVIVNAGYYDVNGRPLGYFRSGGKAFNSRVLYRGRKIALHFGALFAVGQEDGRPKIVSRQAFEDSGVREAFQAGPHLVADRKPVKGLARYREYLRPTRRTVVGLDAKDRLVILVSENETRGVSWCELQEYLVLSESKGGLGLRDAMNLDGGSSSQLWVRAGGPAPEIHIPGRPTPTFIVIAPRE